MASSRKKPDAAKSKRIQELAQGLRELLPEGTFAERELSMLELVSAIQKELSRQELQELADDVPDEVKAKGKTYKRHQTGIVQYHTLAGPVQIVRDTYRERGVRNGPTIVPLELIAGIAERATPALAKNVVHGYARHDMRTHGEVLLEAHCSPPPRATLERMAKALAEAASSAVLKVEKIAFRTEKVPTQACGVTVGLDRTSVPMAEELPPDAAHEPPRRTRPYQRTPPAPMTVAWRMAYVGTVCLVDARGDAIKTYRWAATAADGPTVLTARMGWQLAKILQQAPHLTLAIVQDGAPEMWNLARDLVSSLQERGLVEDWLEAIDLPHLMGRLGEAFQLAHGSPSAVLDRWKAELLQSNSAIDTIEAVLERGLGKLQGKDQEILQEHLTYIANNKDRMRYARLRELALPIGSGVTESSAKNVVNMRAKRSGQRWSIEGLRNVLTLRALLKSERLGRFWDVFSKRYAPRVIPLPALS